MWIQAVPPREHLRSDPIGLRGVGSREIAGPSRSCPGQSLARGGGGSQLPRTFSLSVFAGKTALVAREASEGSVICGQ